MAMINKMHLSDVLFKRAVAGLYHAWIKSFQNSHTIFSFVPSLCASLKWAILFRFPSWKSVCTYHFFHASWMPYLVHICFYCPHNLWWCVHLWRLTHINLLAFGIREKWHFWTGLKQHFLILICLWLLHECNVDLLLSFHIFKLCHSF
jgi:hypothetical protein